MTAFALAAFGESKETSVEPAFRFDLTAAVLRGFATSVIDRIEPDGTYLVARSSDRGAEIVAVRRVDATTLRVRVSGRDADENDVIAMRRTFGLDQRLLQFETVAEQIPWLAAFARAARGLRPSRYATLWEACAHAILFQSVSLHSASAVLRRVILALSQPAFAGDGSLYPFPPASAVAAAPEALLLAAGLSRAKAATLARTAGAISAGMLDEATLATLPTPQLAAALTTLPGIGPWTASVVALRAFGRLDTFPPNDSGIARNLAQAGATSTELAAALRAFGDERGMLYHLIHLERIVRAGDASLDGESPRVR